MLHRSAPLSLRFMGAVGTVTGSRYMVESGRRRLLVDCGLFQGYKQLRERNRAAFPVPPDTIDAVLLTHAHLDHSGYLPALVRDGFRGKVFCTPATSDLCALLLPDSGRLQEEEARYARRKDYSKHAEPTPLYTADDAEAALARFASHDFDTEIVVAPGLRARFHRAGHLLGAAQISIEAAGRILHFSGDLGRAHDPMLRPPEPLEKADVLVCESTYGNRRHPKVEAEAELGPIVRRVAGRSGVIIFPAFAVGRAQRLLLHIAHLKQRGEIPDLPVFLNSPMAIDATDIYRRHHAEHGLSESECRATFGVATMVRSVQESIALNERTGPMIIISASGMLTGGRVLHHLEAFASDARNVILLSGFQAGGTRGAALASGARTLRMFGHDITVRAEVVVLESLSGHADADELLAWMGRATRAPGMTYVTHGEPDAADCLRARIQRELGWPVRVPEHLETVRCDA